LKSIYKGTLFYARDAFAVCTVDKLMSRGLADIEEAKAAVAGGTGTRAMTLTTW